MGGQKGEKRKLKRNQESEIFTKRRAVVEPQSTRGSGRKKRMSREQVKGVKKTTSLNGLRRGTKDYTDSLLGMEKR